MEPRAHVVVVGAGFGGLWTVRGLRRTGVAVTLINPDNYHTFHPLLYQVAAAELEPEEIVYPIRPFLRAARPPRFLLGDVTHLDPAARRVSGPDFAVAYDYLVLAAGSVPHFFAVPGGAEYAFPLKTLTQAIRLRNQILTCFERAAREPDASRRAALLSFVIVGGGPTGVEFAGALAELVHGPLRRDFPEVRASEVRIVLLEAQPAILGGWPGRAQAYALRRLRRMGVEVRLDAEVARVEPEAVTLHDRTVLPTQTVVWTAGVRGTPAASRWRLPVDRTGRVPVLPTLQVAAHPEIYVVGDLAAPSGLSQPLPMIAPVAIQQGAHVACNIWRQVRGQNPRPFRYRDPGVMATIGRNAAVAVVRRRTVTGFPAWILWLGVHLVKLIGFRNRLLVLINWAWDYFLYDRAVRLILPQPDGFGAAPCTVSDGRAPAMTRTPAGAGGGARVQGGEPAPLCSGDPAPRRRATE